MNAREHFHLAVRPEFAAGAYGRFDSDISFYNRVNALIGPDSVILEYGAGRGSFLDDPSHYRRTLRALKGKARKVVGCDIDAAVLENQSVDERHVIQPNARLPFEDGTFDLVTCDWVIEHIEDPDGFETEIRRILKPGGWFCARTPNKWGMTGLGVRLVPDWLEKKVLSAVWPERSDEDVFPKYYRLNSWPALTKHFPQNRWLNASYGYGGEPKYHANNRLLFRLMSLWNAIAPEFMATDLLIFMQKRDVA
ncbi:class I SAM-dependent methyltransferase [Rhizobiaceae bacterium BDR2-2]|uniref:Class I SAM-dependent methyltransferase n=1 Tax=Ectorhizobium quercum TaxID=2965071 RepID=A0AAE3SVW7_9HYPH|nr:class I SAM-dependent methyltransferase [Ectorhizobium quercum]MCX8998123.1 class I SAM-dependent methyltransferase [Ectorhizobium quercum]